MAQTDDAFGAIALNDAMIQIKPSSVGCGFVRGFIHEVTIGLMHAGQIGGP